MMWYYSVAQLGNAFATAKAAFEEEVDRVKAEAAVCDEGLLSCFDD